MPRSAKKRKKSEATSSADINKTPVRKSSTASPANSMSSPLVSDSDSPNFNSRLPTFGFGFKSPSELNFISPSQVQVHRGVVWQDTTAEECRRRLRANKAAIYQEEEEDSGSNTPPARTTPRRKPSKEQINARLLEKLQKLTNRIAKQKEEEERLKREAEKNEDSLFDDDDWEDDPDIDFFADTQELENVSGEVQKEKQTTKDNSDSDIFDDDFIDDAVLQCTQEIEERCCDPSPKKPESCVGQSSRTDNEKQSVSESARSNAGKNWQYSSRESSRNNVGSKWQQKSIESSRNNTGSNWQQKSSESSRNNAGSNWQQKSGENSRSDSGTSWQQKINDCSKGNTGKYWLQKMSDSTKNNISNNWQQQNSGHSRNIIGKPNGRLQSNPTNNQWQSRSRDGLRSNNNVKPVNQAKPVSNNMNKQQLNNKQNYSVPKRETPSRSCKNTTTSYQYTARSNVGAQGNKHNTPSTRTNNTSVQTALRPARLPWTSNNRPNVQTRQQTVNQQSSSSGLFRQTFQPKNVAYTVQAPDSDSDKDDSLMEDEEFMTSLISTLEQVDRDLS